MNEKRQEGYLNLIQVLLSSADGDETTILAANRDLLDVGFLETVRTVAEMFLQQGDENTANWLRSLENILTEVLNINLKPFYTRHNSTITDDVVNSYLDFLFEVLELMVESKGDLELVYPFLEVNIDKLDFILTEILWRWATVTLKNLEINTARYLATVIGNFSNLISQFPLGDKSNNIELAIIGYEIVLNVFTYEAFPIDWAKAQSNLGNLYANRIMGDKANNIEQSIAAFQKALYVYNCEDFPYEWAVTKNNLGIAYRDRIIKDKANNIEQSITSLEASLTVRTYDAFPYEWAMTQYNLGLAYIERIQGDKGDNIEKSIDALQKALTVQICDAFPTDWAITQNALGVAYEVRILGDKANNIEQSIACYKEALTIRNCEDFPYEWAQLQYNLGNAYYERIQGDKANNIEISIVAYKAALTVRTREAFPYEWAQTQNNLGNAYRNRTLGEKAENMRLALAALKESVDGAEFLREQIVSGYGAKLKLAEEWNQSYVAIVETFLGLGKISEALIYVERSKTRNLVELILERDFNTIFPPDVITKLEQLRNEIAVRQNQIQTGKAENPKELAQYLLKLRQQRNDLQDKYLSVGYGFKLNQFQATLDEQTAVIEWYITNTSIETFIITQSTQQRVHIADRNENFAAFINWVNEYLKAYGENKTEWKDNLTHCLTSIAKILHIEEIIRLIPQSCSRLFLIPHRLLHLFPLHALPLAGGDFLCDKFSQGVGYAPSCQLLQQVQKRNRPNFESLFAIQNPTEDLVYTDLEVESVLNIFPSHQVLPHKQATKDALLQKMPLLNETNYLHFSCHGSFNFNYPQDSCLLLAESKNENNNLDLSKCLTLGNLFELDFQLNNCRLVILSACETGLVDFREASDEYISLPSGFLYAGSASVVSSLWTVNDLSTAFLMIKFSQNLRSAMTDSGDFSVAVELQKAQLWLRDASTSELQEWASKLKLSLKANKQLEQFLYYCEHYCEPEEKQFQNPYHWAAFCAIGL